MPAYRCDFERIGRRHDISAQTFTVDNADQLADCVYYFARVFLGSRDVDVVVDLEEMRGTIFAGFQVGGSFAIQAVR